MLEWWQSIILGIVEGITEFLPISSTGHLTVSAKLMGQEINNPTVTAYTAIIQVGAMLAAILYFRKDIARIALAWGKGVAKKSARSNPDYHMGWAVIFGTLVTSLVALLLHDLIEGPLRSLWVVAAGLILWSFVMLWGDRHENKLAKPRGEESVTWKDGLILGAIQCFSLIPGVSRSGATISGALLRNLDRVTATRLSFFLGIPVLVAAGGYEMVKNFDAIGAPGGVGWAATGIGTAISFIVAYISIAWLLKFVQRNDFRAFVIYRVIIGIIIITLLGFGVISAV